MLDQRGKFWKTIWRYKIQSKQKMFHYIWAKWCLASVCSALHNTLQTWESSQSLGAKFSSFIPNLNEADVLFTQSSFINFIEPQSGESLLYSSENTSMCVFLTDVARDQVLRYQHKKIINDHPPPHLCEDTEHPQKSWCVALLWKSTGKPKTPEVSQCRMETHCYACICSRWRQILYVVMVWVLFWELADNATVDNINVGISFRKQVKAIIFNWLNRCREEKEISQKGFIIQI